MANRALQVKLDTDAKRRAAKAGRHPRFHGWTDQEMMEKAERIGRPVEMPSKAIDTTELVQGVKVKHIACTGTMPVGGVSRTMRKARGGPVELWTGGKQAANRNHIAPAGKGAFLTNVVYDPNDWRIVKRA